MDDERHERVLEEEEPDDEQDEVQPGKLKRKKKKKKKKKKKTGPVTIEHVINIREFGAQLTESKSVKMRGKHVCYQKEDDQYGLLDLTDPHTEFNVPTFDDRDAYVSPTGEYFLAKLNQSYWLNVYKTNNSQDGEQIPAFSGRNFPEAGECDFCKWVTPLHIVFVSATAVYMWDVRKSTGVQKIYDRHHATHGTPVDDYLLDETVDVDDLSGCKHLIIPKVDFREGKNALIQLYSGHSKKSALISGYRVCLSPLGKGISFQMCCSVLCWVAFDDDSKTIFHAAELENMEFDKKKDQERLRVPISTVDSQDADSKDFIVAMYACEKYGVAFLVSSLRWLYLISLDGARPDRLPPGFQQCILKMNLNPEAAAMRNNSLTPVMGDLSWTVDEQGLMVMYSDGNIIKISLNEEVLIFWLAYNVGNIELAKYWAWRANYYENSKLFKQLKEQDNDFVRLDKISDALENHRIRVSNMELELNSHRGTNQDRRIAAAQDLTDAYLNRASGFPHLEVLMHEPLKREQIRFKEQEYNRVWFPRQRRYQEEHLKEHLEEIQNGRFDPFNTPYVTLEYWRHVELHKQFESTMLKNQEKLQKQEKKLIKSRKKLEQELQYFRERHEYLESVDYWLYNNHDEEEQEQSQQEEPVDQLTTSMQYNAIIDEERSQPCSSAQQGSASQNNAGSCFSTIAKEEEKKDSGGELLSKSGGAGNAEPVEEKNLCIICVERPYNTAFLPCRHMWTCHECAKVVFEGERICPACRSEVKDIMCVYFPD